MTKQKYPTMLEVAREMASGLYEAGVINAARMREYESLYAPECKLSHIPNAETRKAMEEAEKGIGLTECKDKELT
ncbi:MAG: hypothetical protein KIT56_09140 [Gammaproteobacteria bacterium]|nr:hypothetical protein [Gammaproteobacteria bacterium]MCW5584020.1 hypothetical protein [Gammaproteobacteria bacterium]